MLSDEWGKDPSPPVAWLIRSATRNKPEAAPQRHLMIDLNLRGVLHGLAAQSPAETDSPRVNAGRLGSLP